MADNVLTQDVIDSLLEAIQSNHSPQNNLEDKYYGKVKIHDFKRGEIINKKQKYILERIYKSFCKEFSRFMKIDFYIASIDQLTWEEWNRSIPIPCAITKLNFNGAPFYFMMENDVVQHTFKNWGYDDFDLQTIANNCVATAMYKTNAVDKFIDFQRKAWLKIYEGDIDFIDQRFDIIPFLDDYEKNEMCIMITLEVHYDNEEHCAEIIIPNSIIRTIKHRFTELNIIQQKFINPDKLNKFVLIDMDIYARFLDKLMTLKAISALKVDDIIDFSKDCTVILQTHNRIIAEGHLENYLSGKITKSQTRVKIDTFINNDKERYMEKVNLADNLQNVEVQLSVELGRTRKSVKDILQFGEGTIVELDRLAGEPLDIFVNNVLYARGECVTVDEVFGVRVTEILTKEQKI